MAVFSRNGRWYIDYYDADGKRIRESVGSSKTIAQKALEARKGDVAQGKFGLAESRKRVKFAEFS